MQRRDFLFGNRQMQTSQAVASPPAGLDPYQGPWTVSEAAHLLRRTVFGANFQMIQAYSKLGLNQSLTTLLDVKPFTDQPINYDFADDPSVPIGESWVDKAIPADLVNNNYRQRSMFGWNMGRLLANKKDIGEKMTLFWHNHFVVETIQDPRFYYNYLKTISKNPLGNFKTMVEEITVEPAMLRYLNGNQNTLTAPNENYARELLELFTIGKGPLAGPGDYTNYTEADILQIAKILTGWRDRGYRSPMIANIYSEYVDARHDKTQKKLSHRFGNAVITNGGNQEYKDLINIIFAQAEVAKFISRKLYVWFVDHNIDATVEAQVISPMADIIRANGYTIRPALEALLKSAHFYSKIGCMIKSPLDFMINALNQNNVSIANLTVAEQYAQWLALANYSGLLQMRYFDAPNVAGWKAYYQEPAYYQIWINSVTMPLRKTFSDAICSPTLVARGIRMDVDTLAVIAELSNPKDIESLIEDIALVYFAKPLQVEQLIALKNVVLKGAPDYEWTKEYQDHLANPTNVALKNSVLVKLRALFSYLMNLPEYQML